MQWDESTPLVVSTHPQSNGLESGAPISTDQLATSSSKCVENLIHAHLPAIDNLDFNILHVQSSWIVGFQPPRPHGLFSPTVKLVAMKFPLEFVWDHGYRH